MLKRLVLVITVVGAGSVLTGGCAASGNASVQDTPSVSGTSMASQGSEPVSRVSLSPAPPASTNLAAGQSSVLPSTTYNPGPEEYRIGPQDLLEIQVFGADELNRTVRVNTGGFISLPLVGLVKTAGLTSEQLEQHIAAELAREYLQNPHVSVFVKEYTSQRVTVEGAVKKPGVYPIRGQTTLLQVLASAEGLVSVADANNIKLFRTEAGGSKKAINYDLEQIRIGKAEDPVVRGDDIVQVAESSGKSVAKEIIEFILPFRYLAYPW